MRFTSSVSYQAGCVAAMLLAALPPAAQSQPLSAARSAELNQMLAASPARELRQAWIYCATPAARMIVMQGGTMEQIRQIVIPGCSDEESRLTGEMVRKYGYQRGTAAVRDFKSFMLNLFASKIAQRDKPQQDQSVFQTMPDGWEVRRVGPQDCIAVNLQTGSMSIGQVSTAIRKNARERSITFSDIGDMGARDGTAYTNGRSITVPAVAIGPQETLRFDIVLEPKGYDRGLDFKGSLTLQLLQTLSDANSVQFRLTSSSMPFGRPVTFPVRGIAEAWQSVLRCAS